MAALLEFEERKQNCLSNVHDTPGTKPKKKTLKREDMGRWGCLCVRRRKSREPTVGESWGAGSWSCTRGPGLRGSRGHDTRFSGLLRETGEPAWLPLLPEPSACHYEAQSYTCPGAFPVLALTEVQHLKQRDHKAGRVGCGGK